MGCSIQRNQIEHEILLLKMEKAIIQKEKEDLYQLYKKLSGKDYPRLDIPDYLAPEIKYRGIKKNSTDASSSKESSNEGTISKRKSKRSNTLKNDSQQKKNEESLKIRKPIRAQTRKILRKNVSLNILNLGGKKNDIEVDENEINTKKRTVIKRNTLNLGLIKREDKTENTIRRKIDRRSSVKRKTKKEKSEIQKIQDN